MKYVVQRSIKRGKEIEYWNTLGVFNSKIEAEFFIGFCLPKRRLGERGRLKIVLEE